MSVDYAKVYELLDSVTPMRMDCGQFCNAACCQIDQYSETVGIYLMNGEETMHDQSDEWLSWQKQDRDESGYPESWPQDIWFVRCHGPGKCKRNLRPVQCRTFPCWPYLSKDGKLSIAMLDVELPYVCPLIENSDSINPAFFHALYDGWKLLIEDQANYDMVYQDSRFSDESGIPPVIVYSPEEVSE